MPPAPTNTTSESDKPPAGTAKSIIPCTPLAIVKCLEYVGVYNKLLHYGDRAYGKTITVINRSVHSPEIVWLVKLTINQFWGCWPSFSSLIGKWWCSCILCWHWFHTGMASFIKIKLFWRRVQEYTKRPRLTTPSSETSAQRYHPRHVVHPCNLTLQECLAISDVVVTAVPSPTYKVMTEWLKDGCICLNVSADKNFEKDVRDKVSGWL